MKNENLDHAPIIESWLKEPTVLPPSDTARLTQLVHQTPQQRRWWQRYYTPGGTHAMFNIFKLAAAGIILAVTGGFLFSTVLSPQDGEPLPPAAETSSPDADTPEPVTDEPTTEAVATDAAEPVVAPVDVTPDDAVLVFAPGSGQTAGAFTQVGQVATKDRPDATEMFDLQSVGGLLVARSALTTLDEKKEEVILYSDDAIAWVAAELPGEKIEILDLVATDEGLLASGSAVVEGTREARLWSSSDGLEWAEVSAPSVKRIQQIVLADERDTLVRSGNQIWIDDGDNGEWRVWNKANGMTFLSGPGGILAYQGGGQDQQVPTTVIHWATPRSAISEVPLPDALDFGAISLDEVPAHMGIQVFALADQWVMVGSEHKASDVIHVSNSGREWEDVPRPPEMSEGLVRWIADVEGGVQGLGTLVRDDTSPTGLWSWALGQPADPADTFGSDVWFDAPVAWNGGYVANGWDRGRDQFLTLWMTEEAAG